MFGIFIDKYGNVFTSHPRVYENRGIWIVGEWE
jgi:hypothetical protein